MFEILIIEDEPLLRQTLGHILTRCGYNIREAGNGREALELIRQQPADLVITDILMPEMEGIETIRRLRAEFPDTKIIAISGGGLGAASSYLGIARKLGAQRTLAKPFQPWQLVEAVKELLPPARE